MHGNQKSLIAICAGIALGAVIGRVLGFREMWRLRTRADEHQYMAELLMELWEEKTDLTRLLDEVPGERIYLAGRKKYVRWFEKRADSSRFCNDPREADTILTLTPGEADWEKPSLWIGKLVRERKG